MVKLLETGHARIVGITGPPGAGKSTLVSALATAIRRAGKTLAILAVDPTSAITGGAILGDRIRMQQHHGDPGIFIRSLATRGSLGGLSLATAGMVRLMDASGKDYVIIETVGVGQAEIAIASLAQVTVVVLVPGMGDDVQSIKAGILEIADVFAINKSDQPGADKVERELQAMLSLAHGRQPAIVKTVATTGDGIDALIAAIDAAPVHSAPQPSAQTIQLRVTNLAEVLEQLQSAGAQVQVNAGGHVVVQAPEGLLLELIDGEKA
jgi:LAO/AO transport system kinase